MSTQSSSQVTNGAPATQPVALQFEVTILPVTDVDRAKDFYLGLGWRLDADFPVDEHFRVVQVTPPGSPASIQFGTGLTTMTPGTVQGLYLIVDDVVAARDDLMSRGADVSDVWHGRGPGTEGHLPGPDPERASYRSFASFSDPDGNSWLLQEITQRLPGRVEGGDVGELADLLHETSGRHGLFEAVAPPHNWWDWYAAYMNARQTGAAPDDASAAADKYMAEVKGIVKPA
jgi:catechol 2,3-dioxygenase-like lactoylglutathione lyase family enzyme